METRRAAGETTIGDQRAGFAEAHRFQEGGRVEHLLHAGTAFRSFVANDHHVAFYHFATEDGVYRFVRLSYTFAGPVNFRMLSSTPAVFTIQPFSAKLPYSTAAAVFAIGMFQRANAAFGAIVIKRVPTAILRERTGGTDARRTGAIHVFTASSLVSITSYCSSDSGSVRPSTFSRRG